MLKSQTKGSSMTTASTAITAMMARSTQRCAALVCMAQ